MNSASSIPGEAMHLWLDDCRPIPADFDIWAKTAQEAIARLAGGTVELISLDHDLGDEDLVGSGYVVACWIEEAAAAGRLKRLAWRIHSANPVGRQRMEAALRSADRQWDLHE